MFDRRYTFSHNMPRNSKKSSSAKRRELCEKANTIFSTVESINEQFVKLGLAEVQTMAAAVEVIASMWLNIVDFVSGILHPFASKYKLISYTRNKRKFFPREAAKEEGLAHLLVKMSSR